MVLRTGGKKLAQWQAKRQQQTIKADIDIRQRGGYRTLIHTYYHDEHSHNLP